jgi:hypothetical protein
MGKYPDVDYDYNNGSEDHGYLIDFKDYDWKNAEDIDIMRFGKTLDCPERGIPAPELPHLLEAFRSAPKPGGRDFTVVETGMFYGTSTRTWIALTLKYGGKVYTCEVNVRERFKELMEESGYWQYVNVLGNSFECEWDKPIDLLFIDSGHAFKYAWCEYEKFSQYLVPGGIVGWHDTITNEDRHQYPLGGVREAIEKAKREDTLEFLCGDEIHNGIEFYRLIKKGK